LRNTLRVCFSIDSLLLFLLCVVIFASFMNSSAVRNPNTKSRIFLALSILESGSVSLGEYGVLTDDRAKLAGKYYSDKAPGMTFLALPALAVARPWLALRPDGYRCEGRDCWFKTAGGTNAYYKTLYYLATMSTSVVITAAGIVLFRAFVIELCGDRGAATFAALVLAFGTSLGTWATTFFEHAVTASWLLAGLAAAHMAGRASIESLKAGTAGVLVAAPLGLALITSYLAAVPVLLVAAYALLGSRHKPGRWIFAATLAGLGVGVLIVAPVVAYNWAAFGSPFSVGYNHSDGFEGMKEGFFGISWPDITALRGLTIDQYRGILWVAPILALYPVGLIAMIRESRYRALGVLTALVAAYYLVVNSGFAYWEGGGSLGPRYMIPILPFLMLAIAVLWARGRGVLRSLMVALGAIGITINVIAMATTVTPHSSFRDPIAELIVPSFLAGDVHSITGTVLGMKGLVSLLPLAALGAMLAVPLVLRNCSR
jgi:hypothetical protein